MIRFTGRRASEASTVRVRWLRLRGSGLIGNVASLAAALVVIDLTLSWRLHWWWPSPSYRLFASVAALAGLTFVVAVHELGHAVVLAARRQGPVEVVVTPAFGFARPARGELTAAAALAGPAVNIVLGLVMTTTVPLVPLAIVPLLVVRILFWVGWVSLTVGIGNLLPVFPLDGYRLLDDLAERRSPRRVRGPLRWALALVGLAGAGVLTTIAVVHRDWWATAFTAPFVALGVLPILDLRDRLEDEPPAAAAIGDPGCPPDLDTTPELVFDVRSDDPAGGKASPWA